MAKCSFWLIFSFCLFLQAPCDEAHIFFLRNLCLDGVQTNHQFFIKTGTKFEYWTTSDFTDFLDCRITLTSGREWVGLVWRALILAPSQQKMPDCEIAFIELSTPKSKVYRFCGRLQNMPRSRQNLEFPNTPVTLRLFINFSTPETSSTWLPTTAITSTSDSSVSSTSQVNVTTVTNVLPDVKISLDFTTFSYCTSPGPQRFMCRQSRRCLDKSLRCDGMFNCISPAFWDDFGDEVPCQEPPPPNFMPLWITFGTLVGCFVAYWCFYKPGYLPWRLARLRNVRCCGRNPCSRCCFRENQEGWFKSRSRSHGRSVSPIMKQDTPGSSVKFSKDHHGDIQIIKDNEINYQIPVINWMAIKYDDGNHQRELR